ncbi:MAG: serine hydrolase [bacterium]|nr:serine hydrolase [bacterium]
MNARTLVAAVLMIGGFFVLFSFSSTVMYLPFSVNEAAVLHDADAAKLTAKAALVVDGDSSRELLEKDADSVYPIASIAKLFTAHVAHRPEYIGRPVLIVWQDYVTEGNAGGLWLGESYTLRELLFPLLLASSNDASSAIVRTIGNIAIQDGLAALSTDARLTKTQITDAAGLSDTNRSSARDLARFISYLDEHDRYVLDITTLRRHVGTYRGLVNNNPARAFDEFAGGKHGYTPAAGRTFAGMFETEDHRYIVVLLGSENLDADLAFIVSRLP